MGKKEQSQGFAKRSKPFTEALLTGDILVRSADEDLDLLLNSAARLGA